MTSAFQESPWGWRRGRNKHDGFRNGISDRPHPTMTNFRLKQLLSSRWTISIQRPFCMRRFLTRQPPNIAGGGRILIISGVFRDASKNDRLRRTAVPHKPPPSIGWKMRAIDAVAGNTVNLGVFRLAGFPTIPEILCLVVSFRLLSSQSHQVTLHSAAAVCRSYRCHARRGSALS